jgi:3,4-dihydroxy 2-butanone 4-phosphate synthase/GTP cyclohydrolase II
MAYDSTVEIKLNSIEEAIADIKAGKVIIVVDDEDRENEGDFVCAADKVTPEIINFMSKYGRGLICSPITEERATALELNRMVTENTDLHGTAFTVSIDYRKQGCTTGISAYDRSTGIKALVDPNTQPQDYARPGHIFPLVAKPGGVLRRTGHTEATIDLAKLAGLNPAGVLVEILNEDGTMARLPELKVIAEQLDLSIISIKDLVSWRMQRERLIVKDSSFRMNTQFGEMECISYKERNSNMMHLVIKKGEWTESESVLTKVHASNNARDVFSMFIEGKDNAIIKCMEKIGEAGKGVIVLLRHQDPENAIEETYNMISDQVNNNQDIDLLPSNDEMKQRELGIGAQIINDLGIRKLKLLSNSERKRVGLIGYELEIMEHVPY